MIRIDLEVGEKQWLAAWQEAASCWFHGDEYGIDLFEFLQVVKLQLPALLRRTVSVEDTEIQRLRLVRTAASPGLKRARIPNSGLFIQIVGEKDQRLLFRVEHPAVGFFVTPVFATSNTSAM